MGLFDRKEEIVSASIGEWMEQQTGAEAVLNQEVAGEMLHYLLDNYEALQQAARAWIAEHPEESTS